MTFVQLAPTMIKGVAKQKKKQAAMTARFFTAADLKREKLWLLESLRRGLAAAFFRRESVRKSAVTANGASCAGFKEQ